MEEERDFFEAIRAAGPDEDGPTLIYADWLEEQGAPARAAFVRADVALARLDPDDPEVSETIFTRRRERHRASRILRAVGWEGPVAPAGARWKAPERGLVRSVEIWEPLSKEVEGERLWERAPVESAMVYERDGQVRPDEWAKSHAAAKLDEIAWMHGPKCAPRDRVDRVGSPLFARARRARVDALGLPRDARRFVRPRPGEPASKLRRLHLMGPLLRGEVLDGLLTGADAPLLESLTISEGEIDGRPLRGLSGPVRLSSLALRLTKFGPISIEAIANWSAPGLKSFDLAGALDLSESEIEALGASSLLRGVVDLDLSGCRIGWTKVTALTASPSLGKVRHLKLNGNALSASCVEELGNIGHLVSLRRLGLYGNRIDDEGAVALARSPLFGQLLELDLGDNWAIGQVGGQALIAAMRRSGMRRLGLPGTARARPGGDFDDDGAWS